MAFGDIVRTAWLDRERARLGLPSREQEAAARAKREQAAALQESNLETARLQRAQIQQNMGLQPELTRLRSETALAQAEAARTRAEQGTPGTLRPVMNDAGEITGFYDEKTGEIKTDVPSGLRTRPKAAAPQGTVRLVNTTDEQGNPIQRAVRLQEGQEFGPAPTAEMRNTEYQSGAVEPAFALVRASLDNFKKASEGGLPGAPSAMIPGTDAYFAKDHFTTQAKALLGAIVARQAGEGSRLSDEDRVAYSQAASLVNGALLLPGGPEEAEKRVNEAEKLILQVMERRKAIGAGRGSAGAPVAPQFAADPNEGRTATGPGGQKLIRKGGKWVPLQ